MAQRGVTIAGAGPVGLTLAIALGQRQVPVTIVERKPEPAFLPKMERCNARSMEIFGRLGLVDSIRSASRFRDVPMDVFIVRTLAEPAFVHLRYPSVTDAERQIRDCSDASMSREPYQLISQYTLEPLLKAVAERLPTVNVRYGVELTAFTQDRDGVTASLALANGETDELLSAYLVGCDGGSSPVRKSLGIQLEGRGRISEINQIFFRSHELFERIVPGRGRHYYGPYATIVVQDDREHFMVNTGISYDDDAAALRGIRDFIGFDVDIEILHRSSWYQHLLVAERYSDNRVFLAGDSNHLYIPTGGLGMNTGIGDAENLAWKLAAVIEGWGGPELLATYDTERRAVGKRNVKAAGEAALALRTWRAAVRPQIYDNTPEGDGVRADVSRLAAEHQPLVHEMIGTELGYCYAGSGVICHEDGEVPDPGATVYVPSTFPGARLPHLWLSDGKSTHDLIGAGFTLLRLSTELDVEPIERAFAERSIPLQSVAITNPAVRKAYEKDLILVRPDLHVAWRSNDLPAHSGQLADLVVGAVSIRSAEPVAAR